eukprot:14153937-Alexandrium_andersonii.AAC.1
MAVHCSALWRCVVVTALCVRRAASCLRDAPCAVHCSPCAVINVLCSKRCVVYSVPRVAWDTAR